MKEILVQEERRNKRVQAVRDRERKRESKVISC